MVETNPFLLVVPSSITLGSGFLRDFTIVREALPLHEYQLYAVEQWVVDRSKHVPTIVVSTNDPSHKITVDVLTPRAESPEVKAAIWDRALAKARTDGARPKQTNLGYVLVVSLLGFRSDLSIVQIPDGDYLAVQEPLYTNINLRRLGCGGRSGLTLSEASPSQQERFLQAYRLPSAAASGPNFAAAVLRMVQLVQAALSLFDMGPAAIDARMLSEPDGLLCDSTMRALGDWQMEIGVPLLSGELGESVLSGSALAALLSLVIAVRCRLLTMGVHHVPNDPFVDRASFLRTYCYFMRSTRNAPPGNYLKLQGIHHLRQQYSRTTKESLKRAIRHKFDDIRGEGLSSGINKSAILEEETSDINAFVAAVQANGGSDIQSVVQLWKGTLQRDKLFSNGGKRRSSNHLEDQTNSDITSGSESDDEAGFGRLLKGVSRRTKRIGGGVTGLLDKTGVRGNQNDRMPHDPRRRTQSAAPGGLNSHSMLLNSLQENQGLYRIGGNASRTSLGSNASTADDKFRCLNVPHAHSPTYRPPHMRRSITDSGAPLDANSESRAPQRPDRVAQARTRRRRHSFGSFREFPREVQTMSIRRMKADLELQLGYAELQSRERLFSRLVQALQEIDKAYETALAKLNPAIQTRANQISQLTTSSKELARRVDEFTDPAGAREATSGHARVSSGKDETSNGRALVALAGGAERLSYSQTILEEKVREVEDFQKILLWRIGGSEKLLSTTAASPDEPQGSIVKGLTALVTGAEGGRSTRIALETIGIWNQWLVYLSRRIRTYF